LSGNSLFFSSATRAATRERDEPALADDTSGKTVWWTWTAPADGQLLLQAQPLCVEGDCAPAVSVFTGSALKNLNPVAIESGEAYESRVEVVKGRSYQIRVDDIYDKGHVELTLGFHSFRLLSPRFSSTYPLGADVVLQLGNVSPRLDGQITQVNYFLPNQQLLGSVAGPPFDLVWSNLPLGFHYVHALATNSAGRVVASPAVTFWVRPNNDQFAQRRVIDGVSATLTGQVTYATAEIGEPHLDGAGGHTLWWAWTPPATGLLEIDYRSGLFLRPPLGPGWIDKPFFPVGPLVGVYTGDSINALSLVASNVIWADERWWDVLSSFQFLVTAGTHYHISLDGLNGSLGEAVIELSLTPAP
jgi:hypothetical protein